MVVAVYYERLASILKSAIKIATLSREMNPRSMFVKPNDSKNISDGLLHRIDNHLPQV